MINFVILENLSAKGYVQYSLSKMHTDKSYLTFSVPLDSGGFRNDMAALSKNAFFWRLLSTDVFYKVQTTNCEDLLTRDYTKDFPPHPSKEEEEEEERKNRNQ